jgi:ABC-type Fe3+ transport system substrate-binding protein
LIIGGPHRPRSWTASWLNGVPAGQASTLSRGPQAAQLILKKEGFFIRYVPSGSKRFPEQFKGPIDYVLMDKHLAYPSYFTLSAKAANPNAAKLYLDYAASPEAQKAMAEKEGEFVLYPGIYPPIRDADKVVERTIFMDPPTAEEFKQLSSLFRDIFFGK